MCKVSVIVPVYNNEQYIGKCLDSVISQTLQDIEIICVDDCSTDSSRIILAEYVKRDRRIKVLYNDKNEGLSFSRNKAVNEACGEYIQFLDSDDYLSGNDVLRKLYCISFANRLDVLKEGCFLLEDGALKYYYQYPKHITDKILSGREMLYYLEYYGVCARVAISNFVRLDFIRENAISFYNGILHEDILYTYDLYYYAQRAMCVNMYIYVYVKHENSLTTQPKRLRHIKGFLVSMNEMLKKDFSHSSLEFKYASANYFIRIYNNVRDVKKDIKYDIEPEMFEPGLRECYSMFVEKAKARKGLVNKDIIEQNLNVILNSNKVCVFGAGMAAKELLVILNEYDIAVDGIFVTDLTKSAKTLMGHTVCEIEKYNNNDKDVLFLIAITRKIVGNTEELLRLNGYNNLIYVC